MPEVMVTTKDNPYSPFDDFDSWNAFDMQKGYNTLSYFCRVGCFSSEMTDEELAEEANRVADEIVRFNLTGNYIKVEK